MKPTFSIYNASAGSGKTFTLVKEYLILLLSSGRPDRFKNILAITFTNKAVDEMKSRIIKSLKDFSQPGISNDSHDLLEIIIKDTGLPEEEIRRKSGKILKNIIHNYAAFEVSTIDGFTQRILRSFAKDLGLPVNFEVALNTEQILLEAVEALIARAGTDKILTKILLDFALAKTDDDKSWDITADLLEVSKLLTNENNQVPLRMLKDKSLQDFEKFSQQLNEEKKAGKNLILNCAEMFFDLLDENDLEDNDFTGKYLSGYFRKLQKGQLDLKFEAKWIGELEDKCLYPQRLDLFKKNVLDGLQPQICEIFRASEKAYYHHELLCEMSKRLVQLSLLNEINQQVEKIKKERNLLLISEFNPLISSQVKGQPAPFIYERLGERYQNYFIDEFQDTSQMQWENLLPLVEHSLAGNGKEGTPSGLMLVGDAKQSIYRWRGGKAEQFIDLYNLNSKPFHLLQKVVNLPDNFRSGGQIVKFNNEFFQFAASALNYHDYSELFLQSPQNARKKNLGYVNISFIEAGKREEEFKEYPRKVLEIINNLSEKGFSRGDISILTRRRNEGVCIASHLSENGVPVVSSETLLVANSPAVKFIVNLLAFSLAPKDDVLKLEIFSFLEEKLQLENPHPLISQNLQYHEKEFFQWLKEFDIDFSLEILQNLSLYEAAEYIIRSFDLIVTSDAYLQFFLDYTFECTRKSVTAIPDFLQQWEQDREKLSIAVPREENAVQIMTIHKSKGLEFPIVIYPFADADFKDTRKDFLWIENSAPLDQIPVSYLSASQKMLNWGSQASTAFQELLDQKELDTLNVLYVACTRASEQLYILSKNDPPKKQGKKSFMISGLLREFLEKSGRWKEELFTYEFGEIPAPIEKGQLSQNLVQKKFFSTPTQNQAVHILTRSGALWDTKQEEAIEKGKIIHDILAQIHTKNDMKSVMEKVIGEGVILSETRRKIESVVKNIITHPELKDFFEPGVSVYTERDILTTKGQRLRPDRLNFEDGRVNIIDYKTGSFKPEHATQIIAYAEILEEIGFEAGKKILVYINCELYLKYI